MELEETKINDHPLALPPRQPHLLSDEQKYYIVFLKTDGLSNKAVSREMERRIGRKIHPSTIKKVWERFKQDQTA